MDRFYEDIPIRMRGFCYSGHRPRSLIQEPPTHHGNFRRYQEPPTHHENFRRYHQDGGNDPYDSSGFKSNYGRTNNYRNKSQMPPPPRNIQRSHQNRLNLDGSYSLANVQPRELQYNTRLSFANPINIPHNPFQANLIPCKEYPNSRDELFTKESSHQETLNKDTKKNKSPGKDKQSDAEAIKKANLTAKLKKSLDAFKKNPSYKKKNLSIINKSGVNRGSGSSRYTSEIQPCFRWDLPLTVDDLKHIRRCPSGIESNDQTNPQDDVCIIERGDYSYKQRTSSPDIIYLKRCRKRKSSESMECSVSKRRLITRRRRHRSASPKLCVENNANRVDEQCQLPLGPHAVSETTEDGSPAFRNDENSSSKEMPSQSSNVMELLGVKRREFDELVNQPRSPRVQFMLGLLMKRHKELLLQRAMCSRMSNVENQEGTSDLSGEVDLNPVIDSPSEPDTPIKLEGMGASDTIDQLSNILLESSLAVDISSLPQELINQLGTFLEMGIDNSTHNEMVDESSDGETNMLNEGSAEQRFYEDSRNLPVSIRDIKEKTSVDTYSCENEITETPRAFSPQRNITSNIVESQRERMNRSQELQLNASEPACDKEKEKISDDSLTLQQERHNEAANKGENCMRDAMSTSKNIQHNPFHMVSSNLSACVREPFEPPPQNIPEDENASTSRDNPQQNYDSHYNQFRCSNSLQSDILDNDEGKAESEDYIITKLWSIDAKILDLMEEKKKLYEKLWRNKMCHNISGVNSPLDSTSSSNSVTMAQSSEEISIPESQSSAVSHKNPIPPFSNVPSRSDMGISEIMPEDETQHFLPGTSSSKSPEDFSQETYSPKSKNDHHTISSKSPEVIGSKRLESRTRKCEKQNKTQKNTPNTANKRHEIRTGKFEKHNSHENVKNRSVNCNPEPDRCHNELHDSNINMCSARSLIEVSCKSSNSKKGDSATNREPSVDLNPDVVEITDEPIEIVFDSNIPEATKDRSKGEFIGLKDAVLAVKAVGKYLFACCSDFYVHCYDIQTCKLIQTYKGHTEKVTCLHVELSKRNMHLYSGSHDHQLRRFDVKGGALQKSLQLNEPIQCMVEGWGFLFLGTKQGKIEKYHIKNAYLGRCLSNTKNEIMAMQTSKEGPRQVLIVASRNMPMIVRDATTGLLLRTINEEMLKHITYSLCEYEGLVFAGTSIYGVAACDFTTGKVVQKYTGCGSVVSVKVENNRLYAASYNGKIYIYDFKCSLPIHIIDSGTRMLLCMDQKDDMIFAGSISGQLKFWKTP